MKIVAESRTFKNSTLYVVSVVDGENILEECTASSIAQRDELIWELAEQFNTTNIEIKDKNKEKRVRTKAKSNTPTFRFTEIPSIPVLDISEAKEFFDDNESLVYNRILTAVSEGVKASINVIKLFELSGTGVYMTSEREDWKNGLKGALRYFEENEEYEKCATCRDLLDILN